ncbi:hypothetical protein [Desulfovibrio sp. ZJ200]|uniref:hypothetical protein n=1 Tax=Desulfovibrio sp. ZJ200 TaxID=2709792 RepID=UPI0013EA5A2D|nr:hypothetical protein [Desulfovibrio sp. ZJ200]
MILEYFAFKTLCAAGQSGEKNGPLGEAGRFCLEEAVSKRKEGAFSSAMAVPN